MKNILFPCLALMIVIGSASCDTAIENAQNRLNKTIDKQINKADSIINTKLDEKLDKADSIINSTVDKNLVDSTSEFIDKKIAEPINENLNLKN